MRMDLSFNLTQEQKLKLTQDMQLSIKILQMPINELREHIDKEFTENPVLEMKEESFSEVMENDKGVDKIDYKELIKYLDFDNYSNTTSEYSDDEISPFNFISEKKSLKEFLHEQLVGISEDEYLKIVCSYIIESLDSRGYLEISLDELCNELGINLESGKKALEIVQDLEPYGIGARDIKECLLLQLDKVGLLDEKVESIIKDHLQDVADSRYTAISKVLSISPREAQRYGDLIKKLEPKPSRGFYTGDDVSYIIPDAAIRRVDGEDIIIMNDGLVPKLSINDAYRQVIKKGEEDETSDYVKDKINKALFLIKSIEQRRSTLYKVLESILKRQKEFFEKGEEALVPMTLKEISEEIGVHESTVSRAVKEKYILTSFGTIKIRDLFKGAVANLSGEEDVAVVKIKNLIKELIDSEDKGKPYSDQFICDELNKKNVNISRRTVAKYREELGIKSSSKRKRI